MQLSRTVTITVVNVRNAEGDPAVLQSPPVWSTSSPSILTLTAAPDGLSASGVASSTGSVTVTVTAPAENITKTVSIDVVDSVAVTFELQVDVAGITPAPAPDPAPAPGV